MRFSQRMRQPSEMAHTVDDINRVMDYDPSTGAFRWKVCRGSKRIGDIAGCADPDGYWEIRIDGILYQAHRMAMAILNGEWPQSYVDHVNGDPSDNRSENLRLATQRQNMGNAKLNKRNVSGVKGVFWDSSRKKWHAQIGLYGKSTSLGRFDTIDDAAAAYRAAAIENFGEFARVS